MSDSEPSRSDRDRDQSSQTPVAIACQGGGSHTAFTAGVLGEVLSEWDYHRYELVGISGTSGGAFNALAAWYGMVTADETRAVELLEAIWADLTAEAPVERVANDSLVAWSRLESAGLGLPRISPYANPFSHLGKRRIVDILERHIDFEAIPDLSEYSTPELVVGTVDVHGGEFDTFVNEEVTPEAVLASAAVPTLFQGVDVDGTLHWDGLFSQNPPIRDLLHVPPDRKPAELWVVQINPQAREDHPRSLDDIVDRRNELSGNLSLNQELQFVEQVNEWVDDGYLPDDRFRRIDVHRLELGAGLHVSSKLDRSSEFLADLKAQGEAVAADFLDERC